MITPVPHHTTTVPEVAEQAESSDGVSVAVAPLAVSAEQDSSMPTSRLAKNQQKKLARQTALLFGLTAIAALLFFFVVIPGVVRWVGSVIDGDINADLADTVPPQLPILAAPVVATPSAQITVTGYTEPEAKVIFVVNGSQDTEVTADDEGAFEADISLTDGENTLAAYSVDLAGNESNMSKEYMVILDTESPTLELNDLEDGKTFQTSKNQILTITGTTEPRAQVFLNDRLIFARSDGSFSTRFELQEGENKLTFRVIDRAGNKTEQELTVKYEY